MNNQQPKQLQDYAQNFEVKLIGKFNKTKFIKKYL
jgi:hypothetical protein